jgi:hypothetical protein
MPEKARKARDDVKEILKSHILSPNPPFTTSTEHKINEGELQEAFDNRYYARIESDYRVAAAHERLEIIRGGGDPDFDMKAIQPRWNISSKSENDDGHLHFHDPPCMHEWVVRQPAHHIKPWKRTQMLIEKVRKKKEEAAILEKKKQEEEAIKLEWEKRQKWNAIPRPIVAKTTPIDYQKTKELVESQYNKNALQEYLNRQS